MNWTFLYNLFQKLGRYRQCKSKQRLNGTFIFNKGKLKPETLSPWLVKTLQVVAS